MQAEVVSIGDELSSGQRLDTNSQWLSSQLGELGIKTTQHTTVGDELESIISVLRSAAARAEIVVCTGGLGPTLDDLTRQAMAEAFHCPLQLDLRVLEQIRQLFSRRNREMPHRNQIQAMFPSGSLVIPNPHGSAPGIDLSVSGPSGTARLFALPGVPAEMFEMWQATVVPRIESMLGNSLGRLRYHTVRLFGIGESDVEAKLPTLIDRDRVPMVGITVSRATITLRIAGRTHSEKEFSDLIGPTLAEIDAALGSLIFGSGDEELEHVVMRELQARDMTMACVEVGAACWINDWLLQCADGEGHAFAGGIVFRTLPLAREWLDTDNNGPNAELTGGSATSDTELLAALAELARRRFKADIALAVGVYPTMKQMQIAKEAFQIGYVLALDNQIHVETRIMGGHPDVLGPRLAKTGLDIVRMRLQELEFSSKMPNNFKD